jgi:hypothetical protein
MKLLDNWEEILQKAWSVRLSALAAFFAGTQQALTYIPIGLIGLTAEQSAAIGGVFGALGGVCAALASVARVFDQGLAK